MRHPARKGTVPRRHAGAVAVAVLCAGTLGAAHDPSGDSVTSLVGAVAAPAVPAGVPAPGRISPRILGSCDARTRVRLTAALRLAAQRVRDVPTCAALFEHLGADGIECLRVTLYQSVARGGGEEVCARGWGSVAFTRVKSPVTTLCPGFDQLTIEQAAVAVLHEALHFAGLPESPQTPGAMTPREIDRMIRSRCRL